MTAESSRDSIYNQPQNHIQDFIFDETVVTVFDDMIRRSVPGYASIIHMTSVLAGQYATEDSMCYDLGCSLGSGTLAMRRMISSEKVRIIAVDNSQAMVDACRQNILDDKSTIPVEVLHSDIGSVQIENASVVVINFTLQFINPDERGDLIQRIYHGLRPGGVLIISEKIKFAEDREQELQAQLHHSFKRMNGYSDLEISQKRTALENVLIPDTLETHQDRLKAAGFANSYVWFRCFNFLSMIAFK